MANEKIILLGSNGLSTNIVFNFLNKNIGVHLAIIEKKENKKEFIKRRIKRLGIFTVLGQVAFQVFIAKPLDLFSGKRKNEIIEEKELDVSPIPPNKIAFVDSINSTETIQLINKLNPDLIIVNGTRIISKKVLNSIPCKFINTHAGITPKYRGVHGTYWALTENDIKNSGVTVHFVDSGIDTGNIIYQAQVIPENTDNFVTYPLLQLSAGLNILQKAIDDYFSDRILIKEGTVESRLWYHPTLCQYVYNRIFKKIK